MISQEGLHTLSSFGTYSFIFIHSSDYKKTLQTPIEFTVLRQQLSIMITTAWCQTLSSDERHFRKELGKLTKDKARLVIKYDQQDETFSLGNSYSTDLKKNGRTECL